MTHPPIQVYIPQENYNHTKESDPVLSDWLNAIIGEKEDHSFHSKSNNNHHHGLIIT